MSSKKMLSIIGITLSLSAAAQNIHITGRIANLQNEKVFFRFYTGSKATYSDSVITATGSFTFNVPDTLRGLAAIRAEHYPEIVIRFVTDGEDISFNTTAIAPGGNLVITASDKNMLYYKLLKQGTAAPLIKNISLSGLFARMQLAVASPAGTANLPQYQKDHFFDNTDLSIPAIIHTDLLWPKIFDYIQLYDNGDMPFNQQVDSLCTALDKLLQRATNEKVYNFLVEDLSNRFRYGNYDILCAYLRDYYTSRFSISKEYPVAEVRLRLNKVKHPTIGQTAPDIIMDAPGGGTSKMSNIKANNLLLVFWSTGCLHCIQTLPLLKKIYDARQADFEILAVSFDTHADAWKSFVQEHGLGWINYTDLKGWDSKIATDYDIQGTPTFILLDENKTIISKPVELQDLAQELKRLKIL